ncbi:methyltransferase domain protein [Yersinia rochesterensis]|uniref:Methyltransferase domain protein n=1 Tax=Yersinia rochesterensis TaxID=1604335 RepID=A0ABM5SRF6_9GAMM|nr:class I SAM-dependent methyltransferase [Yersinia rochesterensis]AIN17664.1 methyltransferase domain protein [Yersinia rochesterensis]AJI85768.1 methyltransferase domain protein [Yersinia frederiksenii Y225]AJJ37051.1 methyltransferase domain protein [Yersinia rochesterensis]CRY66517.1 sam-dependent methyltransferase [Yersinia kristensenii]
MKPAQIRQKIDAPASWAELPWGEYYRAAIEQQLQPWWPKFFGFHLLKIGHLSAEIASDKCAISHQVNVGAQGKNMQVLASPYQLPFAEKSVDACLLSHTLAYAADPHRILREVDRVLIDDGWLVISNFNPMSLLGAGKLVPLLRQRQPHVSRMFTQMRLLDWLSLLNYEVLHLSRFHVLPWHKEGGRFISTHLPALGCVSLIVARKRIIPLTFNPMKFGARKPWFSRAVGATKSYRDQP